jgi:hypothetical protein
LVGIDTADEMMRDTCQLLRRRSGCSHRHVAIDLTRISPDDLGIESLGECDGEIRFPAGGRSAKNQYPFEGPRCHGNRFNYIRLNKRATASGSSRTMVGRPCGQCIGFSQVCKRSTSIVISDISSRSPARTTE